MISTNAIAKEQLKVGDKVFTVYTQEEIDKMEVKPFLTCFKGEHTKFIPTGPVDPVDGATPCDMVTAKYWAINEGCQ